jgi:uncharacterized protein
MKQYPCRDNPQRVLLFSTRTLAKLLVPVAVLRAAEEGSLTPKEQDILSRNGFLVADPAEERREVLRAIDEAEKRGGRAFLMAVMNLDCNLACTYCYEGGQRGHHFMTPQTADLLVRYAEENFLERGTDVTIDFYGGEPLLSLELIRDISRRLRSTAQQTGRGYNFNLVTNGTLLTGAVAAELLPLGLRSARVTIDGPPEIHNAYRPFVSGAGSFDVIVRNLREASAFIKPGIGGNYTRDTYRQFPRLLDVLADEGLAPDKVAYVMFAPVTETLGKHLMPEFSEGCVSADEPWLVEAALFLREEILRRGYFTPKVAPTVCMIEYRDNLVIHHDGTLYKCPAFIGTAGLAVGDLKTGLRDYTDSHNLNVWKTDVCLDCAYLPLCFGGCRLLKLLRDGAIDGVECRAASLDATLEELILQDLRYSVKKEKTGATPEK